MQNFIDSGMSFVFLIVRFQQDGKGLRFRHTWFAADFFSEIMQQISELMITVVLLGLSAGWTLNISVGFDPESGEEEKKIHGKVLDHIRVFFS